MNKIAIMLFGLFLLNSCTNEVHLGMEYQKVLLAQKGNAKIYCYCLLWAFDSEAYYISSNEDVCSGFNSTKDYCFGKGNQVIYYKFENDTLKVYSYGSKSTIPKSSSLNVEIINLTYPVLGEYENKFKKKEIEKVYLDSFYEVPCKLVAASMDLLNLRFKSKQ